MMSGDSITNFIEQVSASYHGEDHMLYAQLSSQWSDIRDLGSSGFLKFDHSPSGMSGTNIIFIWAKPNRFLFDAIRRCMWQHDLWVHMALVGKSDNLSHDLIWIEMKGEGSDYELFYENIVKLLPGLEQIVHDFGQMKSILKQDGLWSELVNWLVEHCFLMHVSVINTDSNEIELSSGWLGEPFEMDDALLLASVEKPRMTMIHTVAPFHRRQPMAVVFLPLVNYQPDRKDRYVARVQLTFSSRIESQDFYQIPYWGSAWQQRVSDASGCDGDNQSYLGRMLGQIPKILMWMLSEDDFSTWLRTALKMRMNPSWCWQVFSSCDERLVVNFLWLPMRVYQEEQLEKFKETCQDILGVTQWFVVSSIVEDDFVLIYNISVASRCVITDQDRGLMRLATSGWIEQWKMLVSSELQTTYRTLWTRDYQKKFTPALAANTCEALEALSVSIVHLNVNEGPKGAIELNLWYKKHQKSLSRWLMALQRLGLNIISESDREILSQGQRYTCSTLKGCWVNDGVRDNVQSVLQVLASQWVDGSLVVDRLMSLVWALGSSWRSVNIVRSLAAYLCQIERGWSSNYIEDALCRQKDILNDALSIYIACHTDMVSDREIQWKAYRERVVAGIPSRAARVLLRLTDCMYATERSNMLFCDLQDPIMFKFKSSKVTGLPNPIPWVETFVYHDTFEGVHLRLSKIARGGLRWSDRYADYRTEVLGLVKAQQVKNAIIVPSGSKGGFVLKQSGMLFEKPTTDDVVKAYRSFVTALLWSVDTLSGESMSSSVKVRYDQKDTYLVVAADKGTATFSDYANDVSVSHHYWLQDAFASGGKDGFDHKLLGITAKGAAVSLAWHLRVLGMKDKDTRWVGIGDMSGDVFGNGLLLCDGVMLVAAFDHRHIWIDPAPNVDSSRKERQRLFAMPRSSWADYDLSVASKGAMLIDRSVNRVALTLEVKELLAIQLSHMSPDELIQSVLCLDVDVLWNGGVGTYIKSSSESHKDVKDAVNDDLRVNAISVRSKCIIEGGNMGVTSRGRSEYAANGGLINTDFIDNSAGVDCSDHEVNLKILLEQLKKQGQIDESDRLRCLIDSTPEVCQSVLMHNYDHNQLLVSLGHRASVDFIWSDAQKEWLKSLWPDVDYIDRAWSLRPDLCWLLSILNNEIRDRLLCDRDEVDERMLRQGFPVSVVERFGESCLKSHPLAKNIANSQLAHGMMTDLGPMMLLSSFHVLDLSWVDIATAYLAVRHISDNIEYQLSFSGQLEGMYGAVLDEALHEHYTLWCIFVYRVCRGAVVVMTDMGDISPGDMMWLSVLSLRCDDMFLKEGLLNLFRHEVKSLKDYALRMEMADSLLSCLHEHVGDKDWFEQVNDLCLNYPQLDACDLYLKIQRLTG